MSFSAYLLGLQSRCQGRCSSLAPKMWDAVNDAHLHALRQGRNCRVLTEVGWLQDRSGKRLLQPSDTLTNKVDIKLLWVAKG